MEIKIANNAGFCFGVEKAVSTAFDLTNPDKKAIYIL